MKFILQYPEIGGTGADLTDAGSITEMAVLAEQVGWAGMSFTEHPIPGARWLDAGGHQTLDPFVALAAAGAVTTQLKLLTYLTVMPYRNPLLLAKTAATLDKISNGRFILGAGTGYLKGEYFALGVDFDERNTLVDEALEVMPLHWKGEPFSYEGTHFNARDVIALPKPVQDPIPIWLGGNSKLTLRRVAERCQGWMPMLMPSGVANTTRTAHIGSTEDLAERLKMLEDLAGDRFSSIDVMVHLDPSFEDPLGEVERVRDYIGRLTEMGIEWMAIVVPWSKAPGPSEFLQRFAELYFTA